MNTQRNNTIVELACNLALLELVQTFELLPIQMMNEDGESYKEEYQDAFDTYYDNYFQELTNL